MKNANQVGRFFGGVLFYLSINRRKIVEENVRTLKVWASRRNLNNRFLNHENKDIVREIYKSNAGNFFYAFSLMEKPTSKVLEYIKVKDDEILKKAYEKNKGVIILFSHSGPWELSALLPKLMPKYIEKSKIGLTYRPLNNAYFNKWFLSKRSRFGAQLLSGDDGFLKITRFLKRGSLVYLAYDIRMQQGLKVKLFDRLASTSKIPYVLHKVSKAPVISIDLVRGSKLDWEVRFNEFALSDSGEYNEYSLLNEANEHLEHMIFNNPSDYFFFQDRYK